MGKPPGSGPGVPTPLGIGAQQKGWMRLLTREILRTSSISLAEALRLALETEDIPAFVSNENLGGLPPAAITVTIAKDADYERSVAILDDLQQTTPHGSSPTRRLVRLLVIIVVGAFCILCASLY